MYTILSKIRGKGNDCEVTDYFLASGHTLKVRYLGNHLTFLAGRKYIDIKL